MSREALADDDEDLVARAARLGRLADAAGLLLATAESCTGGGVAAAITAIAGSSRWFDRGFVTYTDEAKSELLGVRPGTLAAHGAVSEAVAAEMVVGVLARSRAEGAVSVTGIAGPGGGSVRKPVGTVCFGWGRRGGPVQTVLHHFTGDRAAVRRQSVACALELLAGLAEAGGDAPTEGGSGRGDAGGTGGGDGGGTVGGDAGRTVGGNAGRRSG